MNPPFNSKAGVAYAAVAGLTIIAIAGLEGYALSKGIDGSALTAASSACGVSL